MAPNAEEELLVVKPRGLQSEKERLRPPTYNAEDYAIALRRWGRRPLGSTQDSHGTLPSTTSSSSGYASGSGEMTLRQFTSVSELLNKLRADLRLAFPSFVQEFASPPAEGITLLLETLRGVQLAQTSPPSGQSGPRVGTRRAALDELGCVECLAACGERCADAPRLLAQAQPGLLALAVCLTSSLNRSRVLALQLLTKVCQSPGGHAAVSEAVSTLRLRYAEGGRFRFLAGALLAPRAAMALRVAGISFLNAFLKSAPRTQTRLYIQTEACEAGLEPQVLQEWLKEIDGHEEDALADILHKEIQKWTQNCVDVEALQRRVARSEENCRILSKKVTILQSQLQKLQLEKMNNYNNQDRSKIVDKNPNNQKLSSNAEDEGISSSERSSSPEDLKHRQTSGKIQDNDQETTIDDVIEELRIIVKDAEEEFEDRNQNSEIINTKVSIKNEIKTYDNKKSTVEIKDNLSKTRQITRTNIENVENLKKNQITYFGSDQESINNNNNNSRRASSQDSGHISKSSMERGVKIVVRGPDVEEAIVPAILHPQPPRRTASCLSVMLAVRNCDLVDHEVYNSHDEEIEEETLGDGSDSLLSASRLKYNDGKENPNNNTNNFPINSRVKVTENFEILHEFGNNDKKGPNSIPKATSDQVAIVANHLESFKQFESSKNSSQNHRQRSEVEKKKFLRRSTSHDFLESNNSSPHSRRSGSRIEGKIRKFESLNSFDERQSLQNFNRFMDSSSSNNRQSYGNSNLKMRRSESFHHVSYSSRKDRCSSQGGSDSGLFYITDYDLEPYIPKKSTEIPPQPPKSPNLTKSLDRIDEGLDSMVDIVITEQKQHWNILGQRFFKDKSSSKKENRGKSNRDSLKEKEKQKQNQRELKNDEHYNGYGGNKQLRNDELYEDQRQWHSHQHHDEVNGSRKLNRLESPADDKFTLPSQLNRTGSRHDSFSYEKTGSKFSGRPNESGIFAGRPYDAFGLGKNRFNAGKYSGNHLPKESVGGVRNSTSSHVTKHGKVTDILSGLY
ncbi:myb-like protein D isoform X2 [Leptopilina boulardi]|nr:myb-like protein D isoform X2 [Leptopilina boulardi]